MSATEVLTSSRRSTPSDMRARNLTSSVLRLRMDASASVPSCKRAFGALYALANSSRSEAVGRRLRAERQFGAVCRELGVHHSASTLHIPWAVIASSPAPDSRVVSVILSSPSFGLRQKESHVHREPENWRMSSTLTRPHSIRRTDDKALAARFVACTPSSIPSVP